MIRPSNVPSAARALSTSDDKLARKVASAAVARFVSVVTAPDAAVLKLLIAVESVESAALK